MKQNNRWIYVISGVFILLLAGMIYAWSVLELPIAQEFPNWSKTQISLTFTVTMIFFCLGCLVNGLISKKVKAADSTRLAAIFMLVGFLLSSIIKTPNLLLITFGVMCGFGSGLVYNAVMVTVNRWFPDKQGLISGISLMSFGFSSFLVGKAYQAFTPVEIGGWRVSFRVMAILTAVVLVACSFILKAPSSDFKVEVKQTKKRYVNPVSQQMDTKSMIKTPVFWLYFVWAILLSAAGLALVSQASGIVNQVDSSVAASTVATAVGLISIFNGIGRVIVGASFDKFGRAITMSISNICFILTAIVLMIALSTGSFGILVVGFILGGLSYGGVTPVNSAFVSSYFGLKNYPTNYSVVNLNLIIASFGSMISGILYDSTSSYNSTFILIIGLAVCGIMASALISVFDAKTLKKLKQNNK